MAYNNAAPPPYAVHVTPQYGAPVGTPYAMQMGSDAAVVRDYLAWSIINLFCGWGIGGCLPLVFSILCRNSKNVNNYSEARTMSTLALISNIIITIGGLIGWITFIILISIYIAEINKYT
jgi:hypothetical protein